MTTSPAAPASENSSDPADLSTEASDLRFAIFRLSRRLRAERALDRLSDPQFSVLVGLKVHGPHTLSALADRERVTAPSMNRTVNCLEDLGYLTRSADSDDRRKVNIEITDSGRGLVEETVRRRDTWLAEALRELDDDERAVLYAAGEVMRKVAAR